MKKITILFITLLIIGCGFGLGYALGTSQAFEQYPQIINIEPPFAVDQTLESSFTNEKTVYLPTANSGDNASKYLYTRVSVECSDINIYLLDDEQSLEDSTPIDTIAGQDGNCTSEGSFIDFDNTYPNQQIVLQSEAPFSGVTYQGIAEEEVLS